MQCNYSTSFNNGCVIEKVVWKSYLFSQRVIVPAIFYKMLSVNIPSKFNVYGIIFKHNKAHFQWLMLQSEVSWDLVKYKRKHLRKESWLMRFLPPLIKQKDIFMLSKFDCKRLLETAILKSMSIHNVHGEVHASIDVTSNLRE